MAFACLEKSVHPCGSSSKGNCCFFFIKKSHIYSKLQMYLGVLYRQQLPAISLARKPNGLDESYTN